MSLTKPVPSLSDLCLQSIAENVVYYSQIFRISSKDEKRQTECSIFQRLFGTLLVEKLFLLYEHNRGKAASDAELPSDCLFLGRERLYESDYNRENLQMCLHFIFSEQTEKIFANYSCRLRPGISNGIFSHIFTTCRCLKHLDLHRASFNESHFFKALPQWNNLTSLNLSQTTCTDFMIMRIWDFLPDLQELFLSFCWNVSDESLLYLCKTHFKNGVQDTCREHGLCTHLGKKLKILDIDYTSVTLIGVTCALYHLQSLQYLFQAALPFLKEYTSFALLGILADSSNDKHKPLFGLKQLDCRYLTNAEDILRVLSLTPALEKLCISASIKTLEILTRNYIPSIHDISAVVFRNPEILQTMPFQNFFKKYGCRLRTLTLDIKQGAYEVGVLHVMEMRRMIDMLKECRNLKELRITGSLKLVDTDTDFTYEVPNCMEGVQILDLTGLRKMELPHYGRFLEVLKQPRILKIFAVSPFIAENILPEILPMTNFRTLEKLVIRNADMDNIPIHRYLSNQSNLKEIELTNCSIGINEMEIFRNLAKENAFFLNVHYSYYRYRLFRYHRCCQPHDSEMMTQFLSSSDRHALRGLSN